MMGAANQNLTTDWYSTMDIIVIGTGFSGLAAAIEAFDAGSSVIVLEKRSKIGGNSIIAYGCINAVYPLKQNAQGIEDSVEKHTEHTWSGGDYRANPERIEAVVNEGEATIQWLDGIGVEWEKNIIQGYGSLWPRSHMPVGRGMSIIKKMADEVKKRKIPVLLNHKATRIIRDNSLDGEVMGVEVVFEDQIQCFRASKALILACGGFASDDVMVGKHEYRFKDLASSGIKEATGELIVAAQNIGADIVGMDHIQGVPWPYDLRTGKRYTIKVINYGNIQHVIHVNWEGKRFINSDARRNEITDAIMALPEKCSFVVSDDKIRELNGIDLADAWKRVDNGLMFGGNSLQELADKMGIPSDSLKTTVARYNSFVENKEDPEFNQAPHMLVNKIEKPPFWATLLSIARHYTCGGLRVGGSGWTQVLDRNGRVIPRFYAAGEVTGGFHGTNRLGCNATLECIVAGRWAGQFASGE
ncbi:MAG: flavocytochrome c [Candidatus Thorarchaeota archaeon]